MRIELRGVTKQFGALRALDGVGLQVDAGQRVALIGPNGSGKSTLLRTLMGMVACEGEVRLDGRSPFRDRSALAQRMAYVPQVAPMLGAPVGELVRALCGLRGIPEARVVELGAALELPLAALRDRPFRGLSGGMKQKLLIALALAARASLLILDEPTASLDARARERFFELVEQHASDATMVLCSHRLEEIRHLVDRVVALQDGKVTFDGSAAEFLDARARSVVEVCVSEVAEPRWLQARGFQRASAGWWHRTVTQAEKVALLAGLTGGLGAALQNVVVRDLEAVEVSAGERHG